MVAEFARLLDTGDTNDMPINLTSHMYVLYAWNPSQPISNILFTKTPNYDLGNGIIPKHSAGSNTWYGTSHVHFGEASSTCTDELGDTAHSFTSADGSFSLKWEVDGDTITFTMKAAVTGWVSVGLNEVAPSMGT